ncbi:FAD-binding-3 domain-containing protein [Mycena sanguinolenta]|uniref:FAD-binding-3 domain-containing protein n=1 Tax=Mycena sanguinolenta TaxID=230812 RepID=A0A8H6Z2B6_9AGAR|nr:FAD-binding-3 domain-containing protein [Mycena sanguinolenta]
MTNSGLNFIIVGASVSGLASAIALKRAGHSVLVLEKELELGGIGSVPNGSGCAQICPNGCKILLDWGLEAEVNAKSATCSGFSLYKYTAGEASGPDQLGINRYDPVVLDEARGRYLQFAHRDLVRMLYDAAAVASSDKIESSSAARVSIVFGAEVVNVDCDACSVTLQSGDIHTAHAIIGADGTTGVVRRRLIEEEGASRQSDDGLGVALYHATVPKALVDEHDLTVFYHHLGMTAWLGPNRGLKTLVVGNEQDISMFLFTPDSCQDSTWTREAETKITEVLGPCDERIRKLVELAGSVACIQHEPPSKLESWVSKSGRVLVLGDAAHPFPPGASQAYGVALEDAAFIGKIFSHAKNPTRVPDFFRAFQEHREPRVSHLLDIEDEYRYYILMPDGETQVERDAAFRARHAIGQNVFDGDLEHMMEDVRIMFGYNATDDADEWWMTWGRYLDAAELPPQQDAVRLTISESTTQGDQEDWL